MPWHQEPMKDVGGCDKPRGAANRAVIRGCPNGETQHELNVVLPASECIGCVEGTRGSETSQYPQEEKTICDSVSSGERKRMRLNQLDVRDGSCCPVGVVGLFFPVLPDRAGVRNCCVSRSGLGWPVVEG